VIEFSLAKQFKKNELMKEIGAFKFKHTEQFTIALLQVILREM